MAYLNYHHLRYFWAIANEGGLTRAARRLNVSPSSLSIQLKTLEDHLGQALFERHGRGLRLTEAGRIALGYANAVFKSGDELLSTLQGLGSSMRQTLRVGAVTTLSRNFQIELLRPLIKRRDVELVVRSGAFTDLLARLGDHSLDLVLANQPAMLDQDADWQNALVAEQSVSLVGAPGLRKTPLRFPQDLKKIPVALPGRGSGVRTAFDKLLDAAGVRPIIVAEVDDMAMLRLIAREGACVVLAPPVVVIEELKSGALVEHSRLPQIKEAFYAITRRRQFPNPLLQEIKMEK
ncbi:LysR family transcriptional regulator [Methylocystis sp. 9N]|uniref:LysR family transcriptional regulator n=1 Tax=Methylocystis borbori TaxID=3118750 RepID=A0ABU7XJB0_9HYPH